MPTFTKVWFYFDIKFIKIYSIHRYTPLTAYGNRTTDVNRSQKIIKNTFGASAMCKSNMYQTVTSSRLEEVLRKFKSTKISNANTRQMFELARATFKLVRTNKEVEIKLRELQMGTRSLLKSILDNPENKEIKERLMRSKAIN